MGSLVRQALRGGRTFGDGALRYFTECFNPAPTRAVLASVLHRAKRNKAFERSHFVGLALDGTGWRTTAEILMLSVSPLPPCLA